MKNLRPRVVRYAAVPAVGFYLWRLMVWHRRQARVTPKHPLVSSVRPIAAQLERKLDAMALYGSQFSEANCHTYAKAIQNNEVAIERFWFIETRKGAEAPFM